MSRTLIALVLAVGLTGCGQAPRAVVQAPATLQAEAATPHVTILAVSQTDTKVTLRYSAKRGSHADTRDVVLVIKRDARDRPQFVSGTLNGEPITAAMVRSAEGQQVVHELAAIGQGRGYHVQMVGIVVAVAGGVAAGAVLGAGLVIKAIIDALKPCSEGGALC